MIQICGQCRKRPALFLSNKGNRVRHGDRDHDMCRECYESMMESIWQKERAGEKETR